MPWTDGYTWGVGIFYLVCLLVAVSALVQYGRHMSEVKARCTWCMADVLFVAVLVTVLVPPFNLVLSIALMVALANKW